MKILFVCLFVCLLDQTPKIYTPAPVGREVNPLAVVTQGERHKTATHGSIFFLDLFFFFFFPCLCSYDDPPPQNVLFVHGGSRPGLTGGYNRIFASPIFFLHVSNTAKTHLVCAEPQRFGLLRAGQSRNFLGMTYSYA